MSNPWGQGAGGGLGDLLGAVMGGGSADGLASLVGKLQQGGLGQEVESWVGSGENMPVAPDRLAQAFGGNELMGLAQQFGGGAGSGGAMASILAQLLPAVINGMTPQGRLPQSQAEMGGGLGDVLGSVLSGMMGGQQQQPQGGLADILGPLMGAMAGGAQQQGGGLGGLLGSLLGGAGAFFGGGGIALGHPLGATGARLMTTLGDDATSKLCTEAATRGRKVVPDVSKSKSGAALLSLAKRRSGDGGTEDDELML